jgi:N-acetylmuramoyl-L-alanine amidase
LASKQGQDYMASAIYRAFKEYKEEVEMTLPDTQIPPELLTPDPVETVATPEIWFCVQFMTAPTLLDQGSPQLKGVEVFQTEKVNENLYRFMTMPMTNYQQVVDLQNNMRKEGFPDAFVVAYKLGQKITVSEALKGLNK